MTGLAVSAEDVRAAAARIRGHVVATPLLPCRWLSERSGVEVLVKWESQQRTGSFKWRGALNKLLLLRERGVQAVLAVSAGNHGIGVAEAARLLGLRATVVVPASAVESKVAGIRRAGAEVVVLGAGYDEAEPAARALATARGVEFVSPYNDADVIAGQGTVALEMLAQARFHTLIVPTGGGGLLAGCAVVACEASPPPRVVGAQPEHAPAMERALARGGAIVAIEEQPTLADGLAGNLEAGSITVPIVHALVDAVVLVREADLVEVVRGHVEHERQIVEPSAAVAGAAVLAGHAGAGPVALVVTGRNIDLPLLRRLLDDRGAASP